MLVAKEQPVPKKPQKLFFKHIARKIFLEDWALKLVALAITLGLWLGVTVLNKQGSRRFSVPLDIRVSPDAILTKGPERDVSIWVKGDDRKIDELVSGNKLKVFVDLTQVEPGETIITLTPDNLTLPQGVNLQEIFPNHVPINLESAVEKDVLVQTQKNGLPAAGYEIYSESVIPQKVHIRGPASYVGKLEFLKTEEIDMAGRTSDVSAKQVPLIVTNENTTISDGVVAVTFKIGEKRVEKTISVSVPGIPVRSATAVIYGPKTLLAKTRSDAYKIETIRNDSGEDMLQLVLPAELQDLVTVKTQPTLKPSTPAKS